ncbi:hypothetical protein CYY_004405 [Polysphondylium violaceum]|uniref:Uncharacterized protein n=1 Tax=Polysphondylium violaceum TaxID=133409 RepID=A0A8J4PV68_9MYCE|nr:hypothetical protein CYY_004405 [Polysphondylium violaceum]
MGATPRFPYPKTVWTPTGGWWCARPINYKRNNVWAKGILAATIGTIFLCSLAVERRVTTPHPYAAKFSTQALESHRDIDDPYYNVKKQTKYTLN